MGLWAWVRGLFGKEAPRKRKKKRRSRKKDQETPLVSLVLLIATPRYLDSTMLENFVLRAWGVNLRSTESDASEFVVGDSPVFVIQCRGRHFLVNNFDRPYVDDPASTAEQIHELRRRKVITDHQAWISVDLLGESPDPHELNEAYQWIGKLTAEIADQDCLGVFCPMTEQLMPFDPELEVHLRGPKPLEVFGLMIQLPVIEVQSDDPRMKAAEDEARRRWPEFVAAYQRRQQGQTFSVKFPFEDDDQVEFMWVSVTGLEGDLVVGRIDNDPLNVKNVKCGSRVRVPRQKLNDWAFIEGEEMHGGFTITAIQRIQQER